MRILLLLFLVPCLAQAVERPRPSANSRSSRATAPTTPIFAELGSSFANLRKVTSSRTAEPSTFGSHQFLLSIAARIGDFRPEFGFTPVARTGLEKTHSSRLWILQAPYLLPAPNEAHWKLGATLWLHSISGKGGPIEVSNGTGTQTFSKPGRSATTSVFGLMGGYQLPIGDRLSIDADATLLAPLSTRRSLNLIVQLAWKFYE